MQNGQKNTRYNILFISFARSFFFCGMFVDLGKLKQDEESNALIIIDFLITVVNREIFL